MPLPFSIPSPPLPLFWSILIQQPQKATMHAFGLSQFNNHTKPPNAHTRQARWSGVLPSLSATVTVAPFLSSRSTMSSCTFCVHQVWAAVADANDCLCSISLISFITSSHYTASFGVANDCCKTPTGQCNRKGSISPAMCPANDDKECLWSLVCIHILPPHNQLMLMILLPFCTEHEPNCL